MIRKGVKTQMKIVAGLGSIDEYIPYVKAGADEFFCGYVPYSWTEKYEHFCLLTAGKFSVPMYS